MLEARIYLLLSLAMGSFIVFLFIHDTNFVNIVTYNVQEDVEEETVSISLKEILKSPVWLQQENSQLIKYIQRNFVIQPSQKPYNLTNPKKDPSMGQSAKIKEILKNKSNGFFIECGALDGETRSNTLTFERDFNWGGILIEGDPKNAATINYKNRKAYVVPVCLSRHAYPKLMMFEQNFNLGKLANSDTGHKSNTVAVQCLPLYSILMAVGVTNIDYFSLDVEGNELEVLQTIPWDKVNITTLSVEYYHTLEGKEALKDYMEGMGYIIYDKVSLSSHLANDFIFYHPKLLGEQLDHVFAA